MKSKGSFPETLWDLDPKGGAPTPNNPVWRFQISRNSSYPLMVPNQECSSNLSSEKLGKELLDEKFENKMWSGGGGVKKYSISRKPPNKPISDLYCTLLQSSPKNPVVGRRFKLKVPKSNAKMHLSGKWSDF